MMNKINYIAVIPFAIIFLVTSCSYQKMNSIDQKKFFIQEFEIDGDTRESFIIQKKFRGFQTKIVQIKLKY